MLSFKKELLISNSENIHLNEFTSNEIFGRHVHDFFELVYTRSGTCTHYIDGTEYKTVHGGLVYISCGQTHSFDTSGGARLVNILLTPEFISSGLINAESITALFRHSMFSEFEMQETAPSQCVHFEGDERAETDSVITMLLREYNRKECGYKSVLQGGVRILFSKLLRCMSEPEREKIGTNGLLDDILNYMDENYNKKISLADVAARSFYNPVYFANLLKKYCGKSFSAYLKEKRISKAAQLLSGTEGSVEEIMSEVGYNDKKLFYAHFREMYGTTPAKYAKAEKHK